MLLTLFAQRLGVEVLHGHAVDIYATMFENESTVRIKNVETKKESEIRAQLVVDGTGRFRRFTSKASRIKRFEG